MTKLDELVDRYVAVWNEPDADRRRECIAALWAEDGAHFTPSLEARGYREMVPAAGGAPAAVGFDFLVLGDDGRIRLDYQFLDRPPAS
jgi:hypothetical protein